MKIESIYPEPLHDLPHEGAVLADRNAEVPDEDYPYQAYPVVDLNNLPDQWALDLNAQLPEAPPEPPPEIPEEDLKVPDPESDWIGERLSGEITNLPHSRYRSPDLTFKDPPDHEEPYGEIKPVGFGDYRP